MSEYSSRSKETLNLLMAQRDALETEAFAINEDLTSPGPNGEPAAGLKDSLVDAEGFPRADIDVYAVRNKRHRLSVINTDHKVVMKQIEAELRNLHSQELPASISSQTFSKALEVLPAPVISEMKLTPIAIIDEIIPSSPAEEATLQNGDLLLAFGAVTSALGTDAMNRFPELVRQSVGQPIKLKVVRGPNAQDILELEITPRVWGGRGLLGCHFSPHR